MPFFTLKQVAHQNVEAIKMPFSFTFVQTDGSTFTGTTGDYIVTDAATGEVFGMSGPSFEAIYVPS